MEDFYNKTNNNSEEKHKELLGYTTPQNYFEKNKVSLYKLASEHVEQKKPTLKVVSKFKPKFVWFAAAASLLALLVLQPLLDQQNTEAPVEAVVYNSSLDMDEMLLVYMTAKKKRDLAFDDMQMNALLDEAEMGAVLDTYMDDTMGVDAEIEGYYLEVL